MRASTDTPWIGERWWVSPYNYLTPERASFSFPHKVSFHDVTLRDGEQTPGVVLRRDEKVEIARALDGLGVDRIEAGMPVISKEDEEAVRIIAREGLRASVFGFARMVRSDIDAVIETEAGGIIIEGPVGVPKLKQFEWSYDAVTQKALEHVDYAKDHGLYTVFFGVDGTRAELDFLLRLYKEVGRDSKADALAIVDTFGCSTPEGFSYLVSRVKKEVDKPLEVHCHNDFGLATACSIAGLRAGASVVHVSMNGIGERAGNASLEEVALSLELLYGVETGIRLERLMEVSAIVKEATGFMLPPNKPVVGSRVFTREAGISIAGWMKYHLGSEAYLPELVGNRHGVLLGKKSGRHSVEWKLRELGIQVEPEKLDAIVEEVKKRGIEKKGPVTDSELREIVNRVSAS